MKIVCNANQRGNRVLRHLAPQTIETSPNPTELFDFLISPSIALLFLSLSFHNLHPDYLFARMEPLKRAGYKFLGLLVLVDSESNYELGLTKIQSLAIANQFTTLLAFSEEEAARYLENFKLLQNKPADDIEGRRAVDYLPRCIDALGKISLVNKRDTCTLLRNFKSMSAVMQSQPEELAMCHGLAHTKATRMHHVFNQPFFTAAAPPCPVQVPIISTTTSKPPPPPPPPPHPPPPPPVYELNEDDDEVEIV
ncbi:hypothetical protein BASA81_003595 [Batrachochytrium salamandrivorans]|nr:hypothetical protein BASA81_003595 [Batrachochytrium salamandrivorans]